MIARLQIADATESLLRQRAAAEGKDPESFALEALQDKLGRGNGQSQVERTGERMAAWEQFVAGMQAQGRRLPPGHRVDDSRESIYEGRGE